MEKVAETGRGVIILLAREEVLEQLLATVNLELGDSTVG